MVTPEYVFREDSLELAAGDAPHLRQRPIDCRVTSTA